MTGGHEIFHDWGCLIVHLALCKGAGAPAVSVEAAVRGPRPEQNPRNPADGAKLPPPSDSLLTSEITFFLPVRYETLSSLGLVASSPWVVVVPASLGLFWRARGLGRTGGLFHSLRAPTLSKPWPLLGARL